MIEQIRYYQSQKQSRELAGLLTAQPIATYQDRDPTTGQRRLLLADGSIVEAKYLSDSEPSAVPQYLPSSSIGTPGFINNR
jgi:hypothetical protein